MNHQDIVSRLKSLKTEIPGFKSKGVSFRDQAVFSKWNKDVIRFLKLGEDHTLQELKDTEHLWFRSNVFQMGRGGYSNDDQRCYLRDLDTVDNALDAAIENIELGLTPKGPPQQSMKKHSSKSSVTIHSADLVVTGDQNTVNINSLTVSDFMRSLEKEIDKQIQDADSKEGLLAQLKALAKHPAFAPLMTLGLRNVLGL